MSGKAAIITGGSGGQGLALARELAHSGWETHVFDIAEEGLATLEREAPGVAGHRVDVTDYEMTRAAVVETIAATGRLDALLACAASHDRASIIDGDPRAWQRVVGVNILGVLNSLKACLPFLLVQDHADVVVWGSVSAKVAYANESTYAATKAALVHLMDCLRQEIAETGVRTSLIHPGMVNTAMTWANPAAMAQADSFTFLEPEDIARCARFILEQPPNVSISEMVVRPARQAF